MVPLKRVGETRLTREMLGGEVDNVFAGSSCVMQFGDAVEVLSYSPKRQTDVLVVDIPIPMEREGESENSDPGER
jgi:hypothetical protein